MHRGEGITSLYYLMRYWRQGDQNLTRGYGSCEGQLENDLSKLFHSHLEFTEPAGSLLPNSFCVSRSLYTPTPHSLLLGCREKLTLGDNHCGTEGINRGYPSHIQPNTFSVPPQIYLNCFNTLPTVNILEISHKNSHFELLLTLTPQKLEVLVTVDFHSCMATASWNSEQRMRSPVCRTPHCSLLSTPNLFQSWMLPAQPL